MIRIVMLGRTGNNLFQYALGRVLAEKHGVPLVLDASWFNAEGWSQVNCLKCFPGPAAGTVRVVRRCSLGARALRNGIGKHYWEYRGVPILRENERDHAFDRRLLEAPDECMLFGYFQTPLYFQGFETTLRAELATSNLGLEAGCEGLAERLRSPGSVAVHVRRTDYVGNADLDVCDTEYYRMAMNRMRDTVGAAHFFVFSDDPAWCQRFATELDVEVVSHRQAQSPLTDMHLMSLARHHIIANSSYSWWAAWLGEKPDQQVLMPGRWYAGGINAPIDEKRCAGWAIVS